ncbi:MAG: hypothetical protein OK454_03495, partial [Thaumarchaeota archaeon]|nr:hypothetical protein [Nitrososphaerota archaeon]
MFCLAAFILYRQWCQAEIVAQNPGLPNPEISKIIGERWRKLPESEKARWRKRAEEEKVRHSRQYPDYRYQPRRGGKAAAARPSSSSGEQAGRCKNCGGRIITATPTPGNPSPPFDAATPTKPTMTPYRTPNPRVIETDHMRQKLPSVRGDPSHGRSPFYPQQGSRGPLQEIDEDYDVTSPLSESKRRRFNHATTPGHYPSSSPSQYSTHHLPQYVRTPSVIGPSHGPPPSYSSTGPLLPGPSMIARSGPMPPPPRPSYVHSPRSSVFDESLRLPPLQTHVPTSPTESSSMSMSAFATGLGITQPGHDSQAPPDFDAGGVMDISYVNKLGVFNKISPALPAVASMSPGTHTRGAVIAIEGSNPALLKEVGQVVEKVLARSGECAVKIWPYES